MREGMNRGVLKNPTVQQMMGENPNNLWNMNNNNNNMGPSSQQASPFFSNFLSPYASTPSFPFLSSLRDNEDQLPESWSHLLMSGLVCEEDKVGMCQMLSEAPNAPLFVGVKQESSINSYVYGHENEEFEAAKSSRWSQIVPTSSPKSCLSSLNSSMMDFTNNIKVDATSPPLDPSSQCNSSGGAVKKARVEASTTQSTFKVRKEKLGDRITALHQIVSPFGKTDTASVLLEAIGYIRFLQSQIEALSLPYFGNGSGNIRHQQQSVQGEKNCLFPEDPGQLLDENCLKRKAPINQDCEEEPKDLKSRGLCLVPVSYTLQVGSENGADYWAPAFGGVFQ